MAYQSGDTILDDHYNTFVQGGASAVDHNTANVNTIWGAGTVGKGYGQSGTLSTVSAGSTITATQWVNLLNRISTIASHQGSSITSISNPSTGDTISAYTALSTNVSTVFNNRRNATASGSNITAGGSRTGTNTWYTSQTTTFTITFASANAARYFFNAGGIVKFSFSRSGGTSSSKNTGWTNLCSACGTIAITGGDGTASIAGTSYTGTTKVGGSGSTNVLATTTGWYDLTTSDVNIFKQFDATYLYTANYINMNAKTAGSGTQLVVTVLFQDNANTTGWATGSPTQDEPVNGTLAATCVVTPPSTTHLTNTWGTPTISSTAFSGS
jgi:hypothetical protein